MLKKLYFSKNKKPYISIIYFLTCCIVTIPTYFNQQLYYLFATHKNPVYLWQYFSGCFEHNIYNSPPLLLHFVGNMVMLFIVGVLCENIIGSTRFFVLSLTSLTMNMLVFRMMNVEFYSGASCIVWCYPPVIVYVLFWLWKNNRQELLRDPFLYMILGALFIMYIIISVISPVSTLVTHLVATIVGIVFLVLFRNQIKNVLMKNIYLNDKLVDKNQRSDSICILATVIALVFMVSILIVNHNNEFEGVYFKITSQTKYDIQQINNLGNEIVVEFSEDISKSNVGFNTDVVTYNGEKLEVDINISDAGKYCKVAFSRALKEGDSIIIDFKYIMSVSRKRLFDTCIYIE